MRAKTRTMDEIIINIFRLRLFERKLIISPLYQHPVAMVNFVLYDLCSPPFVVLGAGLHLKSLVLHLDGLISLALAEAAEKRQTAFLGIVCAVLIDDSGLSITVYVGARPLSSRKAMSAYARRLYSSPYRHSLVCVPSAYQAGSWRFTNLLSLPPPAVLLEKSERTSILLPCYFSW